MTVDINVSDDQAVNELYKACIEHNLVTGTESFAEEAAEGEPYDENDSYAELSDAASSNATDFTDITRLLSVSDGLESLYLSLNRGLELNEEDKRLLGTAPQQFAQAFKVGAEGIDLGLEIVGAVSVGVIILALWKSIKMLLESIWKRVEDIAKILDRTIPNMIANFEQVAKMVGKVNSLPSNGLPFDLGPEGRFIRSDDGTIHSESSELNNAFEQFTQTGKWVLQEYPTQLVAAGMGVYNGLAGFNLNDPVHGLSSLDKAVSERSVDAVQPPEGFVYRPVTIKHPLGTLANRLSLTKAHSPRFKNGANQSPAYLGKHRFFLIEKQFDNKEKTMDSFSLDSMAYQGLTIDFLPDEIFTDRLPNHFTIEKPLSLQHVMQICDNGIRLLRLIQELRGPKILGRIDLARKAIEKRTLEMNDAVEKMDVFSPEAVQHYRTALMYNVAYSQWSTIPCSNFIIHSINVSRVMLKVCGKTIKSYL